MSTTKSIALECDHSTSSSTKACEQRFTSSDAERVGDVRSAASENGWTHRGGDDFCPIHAADAGEAEGGAA